MLEHFSEPLPFSWSMILSISFSFISLISTTVMQDLKPVMSFIWFIHCTVCCILRVFLLSAFLSIYPVFGLLLLLSIYIATTFVYCVQGDGFSSLFSAFCAFLIPVLQNPLTVQVNNSTSASSVLNRITKISLFHQILNILLLIVFGFLIEGFIISLSDHNFPPFYINNKLFCISFLSSCIIILLVTSIILCVIKRNHRSNLEEDEIMPAGNANLSYISSKEDRDRNLSLHSESLSYSSPSHSRPCSMLYPYVSSAPPPYDSESRQLFPGGRRCHHPRCNACLWLKEGPNFSSSVSKRRFKFMTPTTCTERNIIYLVTCNSCR